MNAAQREWIALAAAVIFVVTRLMKSDTKIPINVPARWRVWLVWALGLASGVLEKLLAGGVTWTEALVGGLVSATTAIAVHESGIASLRNGKEIPIPGLMIPGMPPAPTAPPTVPLEPSVDDEHDPGPDPDGRPSR